MANAVKKLKFLHHLTAASANTAIPATPPPFSQQSSTPALNGLCTPPTSPLSPAPPRFPHTHDVSAVLRNARHLHLQHQPIHYPMTYGPPAPAVASSQKCLLPQAFMVLTPNDPHPAICLPASPPPQNMQLHHAPSHAALLPPLAINAPVQHLQQTAPNTVYSSRPPAPTNPPQRLTAEAVGKIGKDSRMARWERVLSYVREQRKSVLTTQLPEKSETRLRRKSRDEIATSMLEIERRNRLLELLDLSSQDQRSLWSGGSGGTNGVDEFVWSEDEDDEPMHDFRKSSSGPHTPLGAPMHEEEGIFVLEPEAMDMEGDRERPLSFAGMEGEDGGWKAQWGFVKELPALRREGELEGGLQRLQERERRASVAC